MSKFLASVNSLEEALQIAEIGVDIIDLKQPAQGALGALDGATIKQIVTHIGGKYPVSATVGDLPMVPETVFDAVTAMAEQGVNYIKLGFFPGGDWLSCIAKLAPLTGQGYALIAVLFADAQPSLNIIESLHAAGFKGVMLDTMNKQQGSLTDVMPIANISGFVESAKQYNLLCGLAGSLAIADIPGLIPLNADYLGFRGALCERQQRTATLNPAAVYAIKQAFASNLA